MSISQLLSFSVSGVPFVGPDVPGFSGDPSKELFKLYYQLGCLYPFFRAHGHEENGGREPFLQEEDVQKVIKDSIFLRYTLIHYLYTLFQEASSSGSPILRPTWFEFPKDEKTFAL